MSVMITGASGFLAVRAVCELKKAFDVIAVTRKDFDITKEKEVLRFIETAKPEFVIHSAAISNIAEAEQNPILSDKVNRLSPYFIAKACKKVGAKLINLSSDQVYSGNTQRIALREDVSLSPQNLYAKQKLEAEKLVAEILPTAVSLRLTWMYDMPTSPLFQHKNLPLLIKEAAENKSTIKVNKNQMRSVTYIKNVVENLHKCFILSGGVYNYGSENDVTIYELYSHAAEVMGYDKNIIEMFDGDMRNILIDTAKLKVNGIFFPTAKEGLTEAFA